MDGGRQAHERSEPFPFFLIYKTRQEPEVLLTGNNFLGYQARPRRFISVCTS